MYRLTNIRGLYRELLRPRRRLPLDLSLSREVLVAALSLISFSLDEQVHVL